MFGTNSSGTKIKNLNLRVSGSAALDLAYVAAGKLDGFIKDLNLWDIAAGMIIIREAGGIINPIDIKKIKNHKIIASSEINYRNLSNLLANF